MNYSLEIKEIYTKLLGSTPEGKRVVAMEQRRIALIQEKGHWGTWEKLPLLKNPLFNGILSLDRKEIFLFSLLLRKISLREDLWYQKWVALARSKKEYWAAQEPGMEAFLWTHWDPEVLAEETIKIFAQRKSQQMISIRG